MGDRLEGIIEAFMADRIETIALLEAGGYTFGNGSSTAVFFCMLTARVYLKDKYFRRYRTAHKLGISRRRKVPRQ